MLQLSPVLNITLPTPSHPLLTLNFLSPLVKLLKQYNFYLPLFLHSKACPRIQASSLASPLPYHQWLPSWNSFTLSGPTYALFQAAIISWLDHFNSFPAGLHILYLAPFEPILFTVSKGILKGTSGPERCSESPHLVYRAIWIQPFPTVPPTSCQSLVTCSALVVLIYL